MSITPGTRLGAYEIVSLIGAGGMGEVYRATDTKLGRDVALKILPASFSNDPERVARFRREAQVLASLNHPHIAQIFGFEHADGLSSTFIVMEFVDGEELAHRLARGALPLDEALPIARHIAEALEGAHEHGIIHRDLKPANIKVKPDGTVKVLDFGLAKATDLASSSSASVMNSPTLSLHATAAGVILGTAAYMAPEQARGRAVDKRADLWAFGCVLFEMLTGQRAFGGDDVTDTIVAVVSKEPDWSLLPTAAPPGLRRLLARCLEKDPKRRLDSAAAARLEIDDVLAPSATASGIALPAASPPAAAFSWTQAVGWMLAVGAFAVAAWSLRSRPTGSSDTPVYASIDAPAGYVLGEDDALSSMPTRTPFVFLPDGRSLIIQAAKDGKPQLFIRTFDRPDARPIPGTEDARVPFVSPDGKWIGFWTANQLKKVPVEGGAATTICAFSTSLGPHGATWSAQDVIVFADSFTGQLFRVPANGGTAQPITEKPPFPYLYALPVFLPDGTHVLFSRLAQLDAADTSLMVQSIDGGDKKLVLASASDGRLIAGGRLAFMRLGTLMTVGFDAARGEIRGDAVAALESVRQNGLRGRVAADPGDGMFAVSSTGTLVAIRGPLIGANPTTLMWADRTGRTSSAEPAGAPDGGRLWTRIAPDRSRALVSLQTPRRAEGWIVDWARDLWSSCDGCVTDLGSGAWSPDGRRFAVGSKNSIRLHTVDGSSPDELLVREDGRTLVPHAWLADGRIVYQSSDDFTAFEVKMLDAGSHAGRTILPRGVGTEADVSADGRWLAYTSHQNNMDVVMVQAFPGPGAKVQVSSGLGTNASWSRDGRELYYITRATPDGPAVVFMAVDIQPGPTFQPGKPHELFRVTDPQRCGILRCYDVVPDGSKFLLRARPASGHQTVSRFDVILNWTATLQPSR